MTDRLQRYLRIVRAGRWTHTPPTWNEEMRQSISADLIKVGFGGVLELTELGKETLTKQDVTT